MRNTHKLPPPSPSKTSLVRKLLRMGFQHPLRFLRHLSIANLRTFFQALRQENPRIITRNFQKLLFPEKFIPDPPPELPALKKLLARLPAGSRLRLLFVFPSLPEYDTSSGGKRATRMLLRLRADFDVFVFAAGVHPVKYEKWFDDHGIPLLLRPDPGEAARLLGTVDVIIFTWYSTYYSCHEFVPYFPSARIIIDTVDVHWVREGRSMGKAGFDREKLARNKEREVQAYAAADAVWAVTEPDRQAILQELPDAQVHLVSNLHDVEVQPEATLPSANILFFGGFRHHPNLEAARLLATEIFPRIRAQLPQARLLIAGSGAPDAIKKLGQADGVRFLGFVEEAAIAELYARTALVIVPLREGAGIKGKICEAIAYGKAVITNAIGNEGIDLIHEEEGFVTEDFAEMADYAVRLLRGQYDLPEMLGKAQKKLMSRVAPGQVMARLRASLLPPVSICIVTWNQLPLLKRCLESLFEKTRHPNFQVLVHSNGCTDGTQAYLQALAVKNPRIIPILSTENEVFVRPNNRMMDMHPDHDVVLLNNDTYLTAGWLLGLYRAAYLSNQVGIAGAKLLYPDGRLQEFGAEIYLDGTGRNLGKGDDPDRDIYQTARVVGYVSGCAMYIKRDTIARIGKLDEQFHPCYYEDSDYCYTARERGLLTVVTPHSVVYHEEGATSGTEVDKGFKFFQEKNREKFVAKHQNRDNGIVW